MIIKSFLILLIQGSFCGFENLNNYWQSLDLSNHFLSKYKQSFSPKNHILISLNNKDEIDNVDSYFECISECCIINGHKECVTRCIEIHLKGGNSE